MRVQTLKKITFFIGAFLLIVLFSMPAIAQSLTQGYGADSLLKRGMIVGLTKDDLRKVETINSDQYERVHGIVVGASDSAVLLGQEDEKIYVATGGRFTVLVSNQNGDISMGDYITVSGVSGIGMKAGNSDPIIVGKALENYEAGDNNQVVSTVTAKEASGKERQLKIGQVLVDINIGKNPLLKLDDNLPSVLRRASELLAGKQVSAVRVYMSLVILAVATIIAGSLTYSAVRSSMIAIGRNPLSKKSIIRGLFQVVIIGMMVFLSGVFGVYLLLKL
jgi:hypothetical protein